MEGEGRDVSGDAVEENRKWCCRIHKRIYSLATRWQQPGNTLRMQPDFALHITSAAFKGDWPGGGGGMFKKSLMEFSVRKQNEKVLVSEFTSPQSEPKHRLNPASRHAPPLSPAVLRLCLKNRTFLDVLWMADFICWLCYLDLLWLCFHLILHSPWFYVPQICNRFIFSLFYCKFLSFYDCELPSVRSHWSVAVAQINVAYHFGNS